MAARYRARRPRASPLWQCLHACLDDFHAAYPAKYAKNLGPLRPEASGHFLSFLRCGDLAHGFTRIRCTDCAHEYLLPFTCKRRGVCPSCHQRRTVESAQFITTDVCQPLPHRHLVITVPKALRWIFRRERQHLRLLFDAVRETLLHWMQERTGRPTGEVAAVAALHTFGAYLVSHPHVHVLAASGVFDETGAFHLAASGGKVELAELFRHVILRRLVDERIIESWQAHRFLSWRHSGFHVDAGEAPLAADDAPGRQRLAEYLLRAPLSLEKMSWNATTRTVLYRSARSWHTKRNSEIFSGPDFIAALSEHIPDKYAQTIRYYGRYSNKSRGQRARAAARRGPNNPEQPVTIIPAAPTRAQRRTWRALIIRVWGADPLRCPCCGGLMHRAGVIRKPDAIRAWLTRLGLWEGAIAIPPAHAPPFTDKGLWGVDAWDGHIVEFEPGSEREGLPTRRRSKSPRERHLSYTWEDCDLQDQEIDQPV